MDEFIVSFIKDASTLFATVELFILNLTLVQISLVMGVIILVVGIWFFSDGFDNMRNATAFVLSYAVLCLMIYVAYHIIISQAFVATPLPLDLD